MKHFHLLSFLVGLCAGFVVLFLYLGVSQFAGSPEEPIHQGRSEWQRERGPSHRGPGPGRMAESLGMSEEELQEELSKGKTFWDIAEEKGIDIESFGRGQRSGETIAPPSEKDVENGNGVVPPEQESSVSNEDEGEQPSAE